MHEPGDQQCTLDADCTDPASPVCIDRQCVPKCSTDADCTGSAAPKCDADGACVACIANAQCATAEAPICDGSAHSCRACTADADCDSGVCLEVSGECAATSRLIVLSPSGTANATCDAATPCATVVQGLSLVTGTRDVIRIISGPVPLGSAAISVTPSEPAIIDGDATSAVTPGSGSAFVIEQGATLTLEGIAMTGSGGVFVAVEGGELTTYEATFNHGKLSMSDGSLTATASTFDDVSIDQTDGTSRFDANLCTAFVFDGAGAVTLTRNQIAGDEHMLGLGGGKIVVENNVITATDPFADAIGLGMFAAGSTFRFNTVINTSGIDDTAVSFMCDDTVTLDSNIIAWNSSAPPQCAAIYTLYDSFVTQAGVGNQSADVSTFFVDYAHQNYHLSATSPAIGHGDPSQTDLTTDFDGNSRPNPAGSNPDVGAFESP